MTKYISHIAFCFFLLLLSACSTPTYPPSQTHGKVPPKAPADKARVYEAPSQPNTKWTQKPYEVNGQRYQPIPSAEGFVEEGIASWYGKKFHGRKTSNGEIYDMYAMTAAHKTLPMNVHLKVTNLNNGRSTVVRVNDRGPFVRSRIIDLSYTAANELGVVGPGTAPVRIEALGYRNKSQSGAQPTYRQPESYDVGPFMLQVGAFTVKANAYRLAEKLNALHGSSSVVEGLVNGQKFYRVRVGLYNSMALAAEALLRIEQNGFPSSFIVAQ